MLLLDTSKKLDRLVAAVTCSFVALTFIVISYLVLRAPFDHSECPIYLRAAWDWQAGRNLYAQNFGNDGFLYFPQFALLYTPFALFDHVLKSTLPIQIFALGDCLWRAAGLAMLLVGLWRLAGLFSPRNRLALFNLLTWMSFPPAVASLRNGQANLHIAGLMLLACAELAQKKWNRATLWLVLGFLIKPVILVMILLTPFKYPKMLTRLIVGLALGMLLPFAFQHPHYVSNQYAAFFGITLASSAPDREFCNLHGLLATIGCHVPQLPFQFMALIAAGATLGLWILAARRNEPARAFFLYALSACYILLFNFRTESNSYVILAPAVAIAVVVAFFRAQNPVVGWLLIAIDICLVCDFWAYHQTENWLKPLVCLIFLALLTVRILRKSHPDTAPEQTESMVGAQSS